MKEILGKASTRVETQKRELRRVQISPPIPDETPSDPVAGFERVRQHLILTGHLKPNASVQETEETIITFIRAFNNIDRAKKAAERNRVERDSEISQAKKESQTKLRRQTANSIGRIAGGFVAGAAEGAVYVAVEVAKKLLANLNKETGFVLATTISGLLAVPLLSYSDASIYFLAKSLSSSIPIAGAEIGAGTGVIIVALTKLLNSKAEQVTPSAEVKPIQDERSRKKSTKK